jgi:hypothetical protein
MTSGWPLVNEAGAASAMTHLGHPRSARRPF